jgi:uncharacterized membrane protein
VVLLGLVNGCGRDGLQLRVRGHELAADERKIFERVIDAGGDVLQSELVAATAFNKVKVTRILDRLEAMGLVERCRRGMANAVVLKR